MKSPGRATGHASVDPWSQTARGGHLPWPGLDATKSLRSDGVLGLFDGGVSSDGSLKSASEKLSFVFFLVDQIKSSISSTFHLDFISFSLKSVFLWYISLSLCLSLFLPAQRCLLKDNSTRIHGKLHPMIAIITVGDCELLVLRRVTRAVSCSGRFSNRFFGTWLGLNIICLRFTSKLLYECGTQWETNGIFGCWGWDNSVHRYKTVESYNPSCWETELQHLIPYYIHVKPATHVLFICQKESICSIYTFLEKIHGYVHKHMHTDIIVCTHTHICLSLSIYICIYVHYK